MASRVLKIIYYGLALCLCGVVFLAFTSIDQGSQSHCKTCNCPKSIISYRRPNVSRGSAKLAVIVPFRDRFEELLEFVPALSKFLDQKNKFHRIFVINQVDSLRFNRGSLLNIGSIEVPSEFDYLALHDVDLLPLNPNLDYDFPKHGPFHVAAPYLHPRYHYPTFIGGVLLIRRDHFKKVDGMSNRYWGWGLEDDEFYARLKDADFRVFRPANLSTGTKNTFRHIHNRNVRPRDMLKCFNQRAITRKRDRATGLSTVAYTLAGHKELTVDGYPVSIINVELNCQYAVTPWCNCTQNIGNTLTTYSKTDKDVIAPKINRKKHLSLDD